MGEFVRFESTLWSRLSLVKRGDAKAVEEFVRRYRTPVIGFIRNSGFPEADAEDLAQEVFGRLLAEDALRKADQDKGKFRTFLLAVTRNVIREERRRRAAVKRGGNREPVSLDREEVSEPAAPEPAGEEFDRGWIRQLLANALETLERERPQHHQALVAYILEGKDYRQIATGMGRTLQDVKNFIHRSRRRIFELLQEEISRYASSAEEYEEEITYLSRFLR